MQSIASTKTTGTARASKGQPQQEKIPEKATSLRNPLETSSANKHVLSYFINLSFYIDLSNSNSCKVKRLGKDDFRILKVIGRGSFGKVYLVEKIDHDEPSMHQQH